MEGLDYADTLNQFVLEPGETEYLFNLGVIADSLDEGIEDVVITQESVSQCGDTLTTTLRLLILDPIPLTAMSSPVSCFDSSGVQVFEYNNIQGFGPFTYDWTFSPPDSTISGVLTDSLSVVQEAITLDAEGMDIPTLNVEFALTDLCGTTTTFSQELCPSRDEVSATLRGLRVQLSSMELPPACSRRLGQWRLAFDGFHPHGHVDVACRVDQRTLAPRQFGDRWV